MVNASFISRLSRAVDLIEKRSQQNRAWKIVTVRRGLKEDPDAARDRHFAAHPEDRGANIVIFEFYDEGNDRREPGLWPAAEPADDRGLRVVRASPED